MIYCMNCKSTQCANIKLKCKAGFTFIGGVRIPVGYCMVKAGK